MRNILIATIVAAALTPAASQAQKSANGNGLTDMTHSRMAVVHNTPMGSVSWTGGFWKDRFDVLSKPCLCRRYNSKGLRLLG